MRTQQRLDWAAARALAVKAEVDPRSLFALLRGEEVRGMAGRRARVALLEAGYEVPEQRAEEDES